MWFSRSLPSLIRSPVLVRAYFRPSPFLSFSTTSSFQDRDQVTERILAVVRKYPKVDASKVNATAHIQKDLGLDSLDAIELVVNIENEFDVLIPDAEADKVATIADAINFISGLPVITKNGGPMDKNDDQYSRVF